MKSFVCFQWVYGKINPILGNIKILAWVTNNTVGAAYIPSPLGNAKTDGIAEESKRHECCWVNKRLI